MKAGELLREAKSLGATFILLGQERVRVEAPLPLPDELVDALRECKAEVLELLRAAPDYAVTACICTVPEGPTGPDRCGTCALALLCPGCGLCRGCLLAIKFPPGADYS